jgi:hypothetical protein
MLKQGCAGAIKSDNGAQSKTTTGPLCILQRSSERASEWQRRGVDIYF